MKYRKLRIIWSVCCSIACILLCVLWVRSYWAMDTLGRVTARGSEGFWSQSGTIAWIHLSAQAASLSASLPVQGWTLEHNAISEANALTPSNDHAGPELMWWKESRQYFGITQTSFAIRDWFVASLLGALAAIPWLPSRFSLRTLLIATTLIAVALGAIVCVMR
jgi:hypothetical protein